MDFNFSEEQVALQDMLSRYLAKEYGFERRQQWARAEGMSPQAWQGYAELGLLGLPLPEDYSGLGGNAVDVMLVAQALGRSLALEPYIPTVVLAATLISLLGDGAQKELLNQISAGELLISLAHGEPATRYASAHPRTSARREGEGWRLNGHKAVVAGGAHAQKLIVSASLSEASGEAPLGLFLIDVENEGVHRHAFRMHDGHRAADFILRDVRVNDQARLGSSEQALPALQRALDKATAATCAEAFGAMEALVLATTEHLKTRHQFGQPIGKFQALRHRLAEMAISLEQARAMVLLAAVHADNDDAGERAVNISAAKVMIGHCGRMIGQQAVQLHGGMGLTEELQVGHYFKRLTMIESLYGDTDHHLDRFGNALLQA
jgi:alkylation response protein AidB-like acyl-CoA dehydrogenase